MNTLANCSVSSHFGFGILTKQTVNMQLYAAILMAFACATVGHFNLFSTFILFDVKSLAITTISSACHQKEN